MTFEQRMTELGVDLSDLPKCYQWLSIWEIDKAITEWSGKPVNSENTARVYYSYIQHLVDVIDRMETRLVNVTEELNYIKDTFKDCATCTVGSIPHSDKCDACDENFSNYEFAGVPEDWRRDDGYRD